MKWIMGIPGKGPAHRVIAIQPTMECADPDMTVPVFQQGADIIVAQGIGIILVPADHVELITVVNIDAVFGTQPQEAVPVLNHAGHDTLGQPLFQ